MTLVDALPAVDVPARLGRLRERLAELVAGRTALVVTNLKNIRYLTGFTGSAGVLLVLPDELVLATDGRYATQSAEQLGAAGVDARFAIGLPSAQQDAIAGATRGVDRVAFEAESVSWARHTDFACDWFPGIELVAMRGLVEQLRMVKDAGEVARIEAAAAVADAALASVAPGLLGMTEAEVALELDFAMRRLGASASSFETIVAAGPNAAKPHARPSARPIGEHELVVIDFGAVVDGYCSDMTRTLCVGGPADAETARMVEVVRASQQAGVDAVRAGLPAAEVDAACRRVIADAGWGDAFVHGTGHGVGLDIHEAPAVGATSTATLEAGHVVTVEPGVYLPGRGGVRIEDTVVVTTEGCRPLTNSPKDLIVA
jgi:Xaa-Pro aminopeptidase